MTIFDIFLENTPMQIAICLAIATVLIFFIGVTRFRSNKRKHNELTGQHKLASKRNASDAQSASNKHSSQASDRRNVYPNQTGSRYQENDNTAAQLVFWAAVADDVKCVSTSMKSGHYGDDSHGGSNSSDSYSNTSSPSDDGGRGD
jgi:hypothetical protein